MDLRKHWNLPNEEEKYDIIPEIWQGHNVADFIDPDIMKKLDELEKEEEMREQAGYYDNESEEEDDEMKEIRKTARKIREKRNIIMLESKEKRRVEKPKLPRKKMSTDKMNRELGALGIEMDSDEDTHLNQMRSRSKSRKALKRKREESMDVDKTRSRSRSVSKAPRDQSGVRDAKMARKVKTIGRKAQVPRNREAKKGEGDRVILNMKPKHLFAGKRKGGKTDRR